MTSKDSLGSQMTGILTKLSEKKKRSARVPKKRKIEEVAPELPPIIEVVEVADQSSSQEDHQTLDQVMKGLEQEYRSAHFPEVGSSRIQSPGLRSPAAKSVQPHTLEEIRESLDRFSPDRGSRKIESGRVNPKVVPDLVDALLLPPFYSKADLRPYKDVSNNFSNCFLSMNSLFESLEVSSMEALKSSADSKQKVEEMSKRLKESEEEASETLQKVLAELEECKALKLAAEKANEASELKLQSYIQESVEEFNILRNGLKTVEEKLNISEGFNRRLEKEKDSLSSKLADVKKSAIAEYKESEDFKEAVGEVCFPVYYDGFEECLAKVAEKHPTIDLSQIVSKLGTREEMCGGAAAEGDEEEDDEKTISDVPNEEVVDKGKAVTSEAPPSSSAEKITSADVN